MSSHHRRSPLLLLAAGVAALTLAACAPEPQPTPTPASSSASPPAPTTAPTGPVPAFGGDCTAVVGADEISAAMGTRMSFWEAQWVDGADNEMGGVRCGWLSDEYLAGFATVWAYPVSVLDSAYVEGDAADSCSTTETRCVISEVFGDTWVGIDAYSTTAAEQIERLRPVLASIGARLADHPAPVVGERDGWWMPAPTCDDVATRLEAGGVPASATDDRPAVGPVFVGGPTNRGCTLSVTVDGIERDATFQLSAGAGAGLESVLALDPASALQYDGLTFATAGEQYPLDGIPGLLLGSDGVNLVELLRRDVDGQSESDAALLAALLEAAAS